MAIVDIHCHTFNADDLPVRGFIHGLHLHGVPLGASISQLIDALIQTGATGYHEEKARLDALLAETQLESVFELPAAPVRVDDLEAAFDREVELALEELTGRDPSLLLRVGADLTAAEAPGGVTPESLREGPIDLYRAARRAIRWVKLFGESRLNVTAHLVSTFGDRVDLVCSMLVDLGAGLGDVARTTVRQQVELQEKISRLSMQGQLPGGGRVRVHPFVGFDPRHELKARIVDDIERPLDVVKAAIERYGFIGVKLYPTMGWRPIGNVQSFDMTKSEAEGLDRILGEFYEWCVEQGVPVTAHCNQSNYAHDSYKDYSSPENWIAVLEQFPELHLDLGHFGGARRDETPDGWPWRIARSTKRFPHLYADVGNHTIYEKELLPEYTDMLDQMFANSDTELMAERLMFGTDWYMVAIHPEHERFLDRYESAFRERFGDDNTQRFMGDTALRFLGFNDSANSNARRLRARYERFASARVPEWLA